MTLSWPPVVVRGIDERVDHLLRTARRGAARSARSSLTGTMSVSPSVQSSSALSGVPRRLDHLDEIVLVLVVQRAADVPEQLVAARMVHRLDLADLAGVLALADWASGRA